MSDQLARLLADLDGTAVKPNALPPVEKWNPPLSGDIDIHIDSSGTWFHEGGEFTRDALVKLFSGILKREGDDYFLVTPVEKWRIRVDDVPFVVTSVEAISADDSQALVFYTSVGDRIIAGLDHPLRVAVGTNGDVRPYLLIRGGMEGLLSRPVYYQLADFIQPGPEKEKAAQGVCSLGLFFPLE